MRINLKKYLMISSFIFSSSIAVAAAPTEQSVDQLLKIMNMEPILQETLKQIRPQLDQQAYITVKSLVKRDQLNPQEQIIANELADKLYAHTQKSMSWEVIKPIYSQIYKDVFSTEEIQAQIDFYSSSAGQSILKKTPLVAQKTMRITNERLKDTLQSTITDFSDVQKKLKALKKAAEQEK